MGTPFQKRLDWCVYALIALLLGGAVFLGYVLDRSAWPLLIWLTMFLLFMIALIGGWIRRRGGAAGPRT